MNIEPNRSRTRCVRCGACCLKSSPTLHIQDLPLIKTNGIETRNLFTIRKGERVRDNIKSRLVITEKELIKVKERTGKRQGCIYYDHEHNACLIYDHRPIQCRALTCWDTQAFMKVFNSPRLSRKDVFQDEGIVELIRQHEVKSDYFKLDAYMGRIERDGEKTVDKVLEMLRFDYELRLLVSEKLQIERSEWDLIFGRPLVQTISTYGLCVNREPNGDFVLTRIGQQSLTGRKDLQ